jgi:hypothetical protein
MGLMRWMRGGDENSATAAAVSAGLAEIDGLFRPSRHKQTEHVEEAKRKRVDVANGAGIDLERGIATLSVDGSVTGTVTDADPDGDEAAPGQPAGARPRTVWVPRKPDAPRAAAARTRPGGRPLLRSGVSVR